MCGITQLTTRVRLFPCPTDDPPLTLGETRGLGCHQTSLENQIKKDEVYQII